MLETTQSKKTTEAALAINELPVWTKTQLDQLRKFLKNFAGLINSEKQNAFFRQFLQILLTRYNRLTEEFKATSYSEDPLDLNSIFDKLTILFEYACAKYYGESVCFSSEDSTVNLPIVVVSSVVCNAATNWKEIIRGLLILGANPCGWMEMNNNRIDRSVVFSETADTVKQKKVAIYAIIAGEIQFTISHYQARTNDLTYSLCAAENNLVSLFNATVYFGQQLNNCVESDQALSWRWFGYYVLPATDGFRLDRAALFATALQLLYKSLNGSIRKEELRALQQDIEILRESYTKKVGNKNPVYNAAYNVGRDGYALLYKITKEIIEVCLKSAEQEERGENNSIPQQKDVTQSIQSFSLAQAHQETAQLRQAKISSDKKAEEADKKAEEERKAKEEERKAKEEERKAKEEAISLLLYTAIETEKRSFLILDHEIAKAAINNENNHSFYLRLTTLTETLVNPLCAKMKSVRLAEIHAILLHILETQSDYPEIALLIQQEKQKRQMQQQDSQPTAAQATSAAPSITSAGLFAIASETVAHRKEETGNDSAPNQGTHTQ